MGLFRIITMLINIKNIKIKQKNRKGQVILFAVVGVTIALAIGVTLASRNLSSISRVSRGDTSERAFAAAEGGIEKLLLLTGSELNTMIAQDCTPISGSTLVSGMCHIEYPTTTGDPVVSTADLKVENYNSNAKYQAISYLVLDINNGDLAEVNLTGYTGDITLCWENQETAIYYSLNNYSGSYNYTKGALKSGVGFSNDSNTSSNGFNIPVSVNYGFANCYTLSALTGYDGLRIRAMYARTLVGIFPSITLPNQGYKLTSLGRIAGGSNEVVKKVVAYRSYPFMPSIFDSAIFSPGNQIN